MSQTPARTDFVFDMAGVLLTWDHHALYDAFFGEDTAEWGNIMAASALTTFPTLLLFLPLQTRLASGLAAGSVKS